LAFRDCIARKSCDSCAALASDGTSAHCAVT
jgi:hypothetical protein